MERLWDNDLPQISPPVVFPAPPPGGYAGSQIPLKLLVCSHVLFSDPPISLFQPLFFLILAQLCKFFFFYSIIIIWFCLPDWSLTFTQFHTSKFKSPKHIIIWRLIVPGLELAWDVWLKYLHDTDSWSRSEMYCFSALCCHPGAEEVGPDCQHHALIAGGVMTRTWSHWDLACALVIWTGSVVRHMPTSLTRYTKP